MMNDEIHIGSPTGPVFDGKLYTVKQLLRNATIEILKEEDYTVFIELHRRENTEEVKE